MQVSRRSIVGNGRGRAGRVGFFKCNITSGDSAVASETTLQSVTLEANTFNRNKQMIEIIVRGKTAANGNNKQMKLYFGGVAIFDSGTLTLNNKNWSITAYVYRTGASTQIAYASGTGDATVVALQRTALTATDTSSIDVAVKGTAASGAGDITGELLSVISFSDVP